MGNIKSDTSPFLSEDDNDDSDDKADNDDNDDNDNDNDNDNNDYDNKPGSNIGRIQVVWDTVGWSRGWRRRERAGCLKAESPDEVIVKLPKRTTE